MVPQSSVVPAFRVVFLLGCGAGALAERATPPVDDGMSLLQITRQLSPQLLQVDKACVTPQENRRRRSQECPGGESGEITICDSVTTVLEGAFYWCRSVTKVTLPSSLTTIGAKAFFYCDTLAEVTFPDSLVTIESSAFSGSGLRRATLPDSLSTIQMHAFAQAWFLAEVEFGNSLTTIGFMAFSDCSALAEVTFPNSLTTIEGYAFYYADSLATVTFGNGIAAIGYLAFLGTALTGDVYIPVLEGSVAIDGDAFPSQVTLRYLEIPTSSPTAPSTVPTPEPTLLEILTPSPTAPQTVPTPVPTHGASATGDPHVINVDGVRFDITTVGSHELLRLPRRANLTRSSAENEPLLSVMAGVERANEDECHELFVKQVDVTGGWLNSSGPLRFRAEGGSLDAAKAIVLSINRSLVDAQELGRDSRVQPFLEVTQPSSSHANRTFTTVKKAPMLTVKLSFAGATLKIDWVHRAVPNEPSLNHLNFQALELHRFLHGAGMDVGGILGRDDHSDATWLPAECKRASADLRASRRAVGEEGDPQVIAAMW